MIQGFVNDLFRRHGFAAGRIENQFAHIRVRHIGFKFTQQRINVDNASAGRHDVLDKPYKFISVEFSHGIRIGIVS